MLKDMDLVACKVMKIDTEGAEYHILRGSTKTLTRNKIPFIICEINRFGLAQMKTNEAELRRFMQELGYDTYLFVEASEKIVKLLPDQYSSDNQFVFNVLFSRDEYLNQYMA